MTITKKNPFKKKSKISVQKRINFLKKITSKDSSIKVEFLENKVNSKKTIDIIKFLIKKNPSLSIFFIMGADNLIKFHLWKNWKKIPSLAKIIVFARSNYSAKALKSIASKKLHKKDWIYVNSKKMNISSSLIRKF